MAAISIALFLAMLIQLILFIPAFGYKTDKLTDLSYAITFIVLSVLLLSITTITTGKIVLLIMIVLWAIRLGSYLVKRIHHMGRDARFDGIREDFFKFLGFWLLQGFTVWVIMIPAALYFSLPQTRLTWLSVIGILIWAKGLIVETVADYQKFSFRKDSRNANKWIDSGLWAYSRHPNYYGEILCWLGVYIFTAASLSGFPVLLGLISPVFITLLLLYYSGIPSLEKNADARFGHDRRYKSYKKNTSLLILWPPKEKKLSLQKKFSNQKSFLKEFASVIKKHTKKAAKKVKQKTATCWKKVQQKRMKSAQAKKRKEKSKLLLVKHLSAKKSSASQKKKKTESKKNKEKGTTKTKSTPKKKQVTKTKKNTTTQSGKKVSAKKSSRKTPAKKTILPKQKSLATTATKKNKKKTTTKKAAKKTIQKKQPKKNITKQPAKKTTTKKKPQFSLVKPKPRSHRKKRR